MTGDRGAGVPFFKMSGSGNDFVVFDARVTGIEAWAPERMAALCDRRTGVGGDGVVFLGPATPEPSRSVRLIYFNSDGSRAHLCGNAVLCGTRLAATLGMAPAEGMTLETDSGPMEGRCVGAGHQAEFRVGTLELPHPVPLEWEPGEAAAAFGSVGVPHLVLLVDDARRVDLLRRGAALRYDERFGSGGTNVNFVSRTGPTGPWLIRTYERGIEGETEACGTGTVSAALALAALARGGLPQEFTTRRGKLLRVSGTLAGDVAEGVWLCGEGRLVFSGVLEGL